MTPSHVDNRTHHGFGHESRVNQSVEWFTPPEIFQALGLRFDLDPCSPGPGKTFVPARRHYTIDDDGLTQPWEGLVYTNPPYGSQTGEWIAKLAAHGNGVGLVFARTDTKWFVEHASKADVICFISGRVKFFRGNTTDRADSPGAGSMLLAYGKTAADAVRACGLGICVTPTRPNAAPHALQT